MISMNFDAFTNLENLFGYVWIVYLLFMIVVLFIVLALLYHWGKYAQIKQIRFRFTQALFLVGVVFLSMLSFAFFIKL